MSVPWYQQLCDTDCHGSVMPFYTWKICTLTNSGVSAGFGHFKRLKHICGTLWASFFSYLFYYFREISAFWQTCSKKDGSVRKDTGSHLCAIATNLILMTAIVLSSIFNFRLIIYSWLIEQLFRQDRDDTHQPRTPAKLDWQKWPRTDLISVLRIYGTCSGWMPICVLCVCVCVMDHRHWSRCARNSAFSHNIGDDNRRRIYDEEWVHHYPNWRSFEICTAEWKT